MEKQPKTSLNRAGASPISEAQQRYDFAGMVPHETVDDAVRDPTGPGIFSRQTVLKEMTLDDIVAEVARAADIPILRILHGLLDVLLVDISNQRILEGDLAARLNALLVDDQQLPPYESPEQIVQLADHAAELALNWMAEANAGKQLSSSFQELVCGELLLVPKVVKAIEAEEWGKAVKAALTLGVQSGWRMVTPFEPTVIDHLSAANRRKLNRIAETNNRLAFIEEKKEKFRNASATRSARGAVTAAIAELADLEGCSFDAMLQRVNRGKKGLLR